MFSQHIEAKVFHRLNVVNHRLVGRRSEHTVAPISLIEKTFVEIRLVVEEQAFFAGFVDAFRELTHAEITSDHIVVANDHDVVKVRVLGRPEFHVFNGNHDFFSAFEIHVRNDVIAVHDNDFSLAFRDFICRNDNFNCLFVDIGRDFDFFDEGKRRAFKPYRLPDSALRGVPYSRAVQRLFAAALIAGIAGIGNGNVYAVFADDYVVGDVKRKGIVSAFVRAHVLAVDVNFRDIIHRAEIQNDATFYKLFGKVKFPFVIQKVVGHNDAFNPRKLALGRERHDDFSFKRRGNFGFLFGNEITPNAV